jgi:metallo-beta-lactamase family protein
LRLTTLGAAGEVTGSAHLLSVGRKRVLLDCGLIQGRPRDEARNHEPFPFAPSSLDAVVLSHAHIDHAGRLPLLVKSGFRGPIYAQRATRDLCGIMLRDAASLQQRDAQLQNRRRQRKGLAAVEPLFDVRDVRRTMRLFEPLDYGVRTEVVPGVDVRLSDAGHILGAAIVECWLREDETTRKLVYSGDLGQARASSILRAPAYVDEADLVLLESTYGDRDHKPFDATLQETGAVFAAASESGGNLLIPAFAVGRTQELLYLFAQHYDEWDLGRWQIFLDSPLAIEATEVYLRHSDLFDVAALDEFQRTHQLAGLPNLKLARTAAQSMAINRIAGGALVIAGSGMCNGGRIMHHLKHNVWRRDCHVLIIGYQARGTIGRALVDRARHVRLWGETVQVNAEIHTIGGFSAHADQSGLVDWYKHIEGAPPVVLVHGESGAQSALAQVLRERCGATVAIAASGQAFELAGAGALVN